MSNFVGKPLGELSQREALAYAAMFGSTFLAAQGLMAGALDQGN
jgi:hypothetical protein